MRPNRYGGFYCPGSAYSAQKIAECCQIYCEMTESSGKHPTILEFMSSAKIGSKDLARKVIYKCRHGVDIPAVEQGHRKRVFFL